MYPRHLPLENWEWNAIRQQPEAVDPVMRKLLPALLQAEALLRRSEFARRSRLVTFRGMVYMGMQGVKARPQRTPPHLEHRLYALFAE